ncbi:VOC family protein [Franconibacter helveticus 513]|uniref:VOC family protein n=1 Tax=Franconibacter helveticus TaxID=357240 RepID=UPI00040AF0E3|nr:VOC family protein [Franconibacter helveticus]
MKITHIALWTNDIDAQAQFWADWFHGEAGELYVSKNRPGFMSRFVTLQEGATLELMSLPSLPGGPADKEHTGWAHIALNVGDKEAVEALATRAKEAGILLSGPRMTGDGFYEAVLKDPDGNLVEIVAG